MLSAEFRFHAPTSVADAVALLAGDADGAKVLAGGMSLMPAMNLGLTRPTSVVSLNHVAELEYVREEPGALRIGAMTRHRRIESDPLIRRWAPPLSRAASFIGDVQIRNRGTIGGSLAHADPAADYLPVMVALDATFTLAGSDGRRSVKARDFFVDVLRTAAGPGEILVEVEVPKLAEDAGSAYLRLARVEGSFAIVNAAAIAGAGAPVLAVGGATATPVLVDVPAEVEQVGDAAYEACEDAFGDLSAPAEYRRAMARVYARRAVEAALAARP
jgi:carbon-monoxide dehydrogenase medium subunit